MGLLNTFISNVFDTYPTEQFVNQFVSGKSIDISKILKHNFLKLSVFYSHIWQQIYKTYPTKRDFINFVNLIKTLPETHIEFDKTFIEKTLNTFIHVKMGLIKQLDTIEIYNSVQALVVDFDENEKFVQNFLLKKWRYRFESQVEPASANLFVNFAEIYKAYKPPSLYEYQINPITENYNETVIFGDDDNEYLTEHEKIQYTIYKDNHFFMKIIDSIGVLFDEEPCFDESTLSVWLNTLGSFDKFVILLNYNDTNHDPSCCYPGLNQTILSMFPSVFSNFIFVSNKDHPTHRSLSAKKDNSIYYVRAHKPVQNTETAEITKSYDRYVINTLEEPSKARVNKYVVLDPIKTLEPSEYDVLCAPRAYDYYVKTFGESTDYKLTTDQSKKTSYVLDMFGELDLTDYMGNGVIPVAVSSPIIKDLSTGYQILSQKMEPLKFLKTQNAIVTDNIRKNNRYFAVLKHVSVFEYFWKQHIQLSCPVRSINSRNGLLLYMNFVYSYFVNRLDKIISIEDKDSKNKQYKTVLLDNRANPLSVFSVIFTLSNLNVMWSCKVYTSKASFEYYKSLIGDIAEIVHYPELDVKKFHIDVYNNILKSTDFWKSTDSVKTLLIQDDGILLQPGIEKFMNYDYIGASWVDNVANDYIKNNITEDLVGNGGFSLRSTEMMIKACDSFEKEKSWLFYKNVTQIPEDVYFVYCLKKLDATLPKFQAGNEFACEQVCNINCIGVHKMWAYHISNTTLQLFGHMLKK